MSVFDIDNNKSATASSFSQRAHYGTPASSASSKRSNTSKSSNASNSNKITDRHFTPRTRRLAVASKAHVRTAIVYHPNGPFNPVSGRIARMEFAWNTLWEAAQNTKDTGMKDAFKRASKNDHTKKNLVTFVSEFRLLNSS